MSYVLLYDERELLLKVAAGDEPAFRVLFERYHQLLGTHIMRITRSRELTEEVVQDVFLKIWMSRETLSEVQDLRAYLYIVSRNHALNCLKALARRHTSFDEVDWSFTEETLPASEMIAGEDYYGLIDEAIDSLPPRQQKVYLLSRHERMKYSQIAEELNISKETVKKYLQIATESISGYILKRVSGSISALFLLFS